MLRPVSTPERELRHPVKELPAFPALSVAPQRQDSLAGSARAIALPPIQMLPSAAPCAQRGPPYIKNAMYRATPPAATPATTRNAITR